MTPTARVLLISGSLRAGSTNTALLRTAAALAPGTGVNATLYESLRRLPHFDPDDDHDPVDPTVADLRWQLGAADAVLFSTPEYAGALPGSFKNLLDWTVGGGETYGKPVAFVNASGAPNGAADAHQSLRKVLGYTGAIMVEAACAHIQVARRAIGPDGLVADPAIRQQITDVLGILAESCQPGAGAPVIETAKPPARPR